VEVRERWRVGWIEETERKTMGCGMKDGSDLHHVSCFLFVPNHIHVPCCVFGTLTRLV
jgi:hypothetical protein